METLQSTVAVPTTCDLMLVTLSYWSMKSTNRLTNKLSLLVSCDGLLELKVSLLLGSNGQRLLLQTRT